MGNTWYLKGETYHSSIWISRDSCLRVTELQFEVAWTKRSLIGRIQCEMGLRVLWTRNFYPSVQSPSPLSTFLSMFGFSLSNQLLSCGRKIGTSKTAFMPHPPKRDWGPSLLSHLKSIPGISLAGIMCPPLEQFTLATGEGFCPWHPLVQLHI